MKVCNTCKTKKPLSGFSRHPDTKDGRQGKCKTCHSSYASAQYQKNKAFIRRQHLYKKYRLTIEDWDLMFQKQGGKCAICRKDHKSVTKGLHVDHCHKTGIVRGLLCNICNITLGRIKDSIDWMDSAKKYLSAP